MESFGSPSRGPIGLCLYPRPPLQEPQLLRQQKALAQKQGVAFVVFGFPYLGAFFQARTPKTPVLPSPSPLFCEGGGGRRFLKGAKPSKKGGGGHGGEHEAGKASRGGNGLPGDGRGFGEGHPDGFGREAFELRGTWRIQLLRSGSSGFWSGTKSASAGTGKGSTSTRSRTWKPFSRWTPRTA